MNCSIHKDRESVDKCPQCGNYICADCYSYYNSHICVCCALSNKKAFKKRLLMDYFFIIGGALIGVLIVFNMLSALNLPWYLALLIGLGLIPSIKLVFFSPRESSEVIIYDATGAYAIASIFVFLLKVLFCVIIAVFAVPVGIVKLIVSTKKYFSYSKNVEEGLKIIVPKYYEDVYSKK